MYNRIFLSRMRRYLRKDIELPNKCYNKWIFNDVTIECHCKNKCIYRTFTIKHWIDYSDQMYKDYLKEWKSNK